VAGAVLLLLCGRLPSASVNGARGQRLALALLLGLLVILVGVQFQDYLVVRIARYVGEADGGASGLVYPDIGASVRETRTVHWMASLQGAAFFWWLGIAGLLGFVYLSAKRPIALLLAPMLVMGLLSLRLGVRFAMFAGPVLVLGVIIPLDGWLAGWQPARRRGIPASAVISGAMLLVGIAFVQRAVARLPIEPVLSPPHAAALRTLRSRAGAEGLIWTWWDYGYASEYFAGLPAFANGGRNSGQYLFPLGRVLGSDDLRTSARMMGFSAARGGAPWEVWDAWGPEAVDAWLDRLPEAAPEANTSIPQYLVVQWEAIALLPWIQHYGSWDFTDGVGVSSEVLQFSQPLELDLENGRFTERSGRAFDLSSADLLSSSGVRHFAFPQNGGGLHLLMRMDSYAAYLLDDRAYRSALVTLLLAPGSSFDATAPFQLLVDGTPDVRVLQLR
jgi:dolichyl-diphosphooligosaccharide--protein glycosyltransferase